MPSLEQATVEPQHGDYIEQPHNPITLPDPQNPSGPNPFLRCPLPLAFDGPPVDALRQFYRNGEIPQTRIITPNLHPVWEG